jgi:hypothetical protein
MTGRIPPHDLQEANRLPGFPSLDNISPALVDSFTSRRISARKQKGDETTISVPLLTSNESQLLSNIAAYKHMPFFCQHRSNHGSALIHLPLCLLVHLPLALSNNLPHALPELREVMLQHH